MAQSAVQLLYARHALGLHGACGLHALSPCSRSSVSLHRSGFLHSPRHRIDKVVLT